MLDAKSHEILRILQQKARIPNVEVSRQVGLAPSAVLERIRKLEKQGFIDGYEVLLNPERFNCALVAFIHVQIEGDKHHTLANSLAELTESQEVHYISGSDSFLVKIRTSDTASLGQLLKNKITLLPGVISTRTETVLETIKETSRIPMPYAPPVED